MARSTYLLGAIHAVAALLILAMGFSSTLQGLWMQSMHLRFENYAAWAAMQPLPKMYNFDNEIWHDLASPQEVEALQYLRVNHYPAQYLTFAQERRIPIISERPVHLFIRSRYRDHCMTTAYRMYRDQDSSAVSSRYLVRIQPGFFDPDLPACP